MLLNNNNKIIAIIPARGGSKGVKRKNIRNFNGYPLIYWTIKEARKSKYIDRLVVSTEDQEISEICKKYNVEVIHRPLELATDEAPTIDVLLHVLNWLSIEDGYNSDYTLLLQCTSPFRKASQIDDAIEMLLSKSEEYDSLKSISLENYPPWWLNIIDENGSLKRLFKYEGENKPTRRQDFPQTYRSNGAIKICKTKQLIDKRTISAGKTLPYIMGFKESIDIDTEEDLEYAEFLAAKAGSV